MEGNRDRDKGYYKEWRKERGDDRSESERRIVSSRRKSRSRTSLLFRRNRVRDERNEKERDR